MREKLKIYLLCVMVFLTYLSYQNLALAADPNVPQKPQNFRLEFDAQDHNQSVLKVGFGLDFLLKLVQESFNGYQDNRFSSEISAPKTLKIFEDHIIKLGDGEGKIFTEPLKISEDDLVINKYTSAKNDFLKQINKNISFTRKALLAEQEMHSRYRMKMASVSKLEDLTNNLKAQKDVLSYVPEDQKNKIKNKIKLIEITLEEAKIDVKNEENHIIALEKEINELRKKVTNISPDIPVDYLAKTAGGYSIEELVEVKVPLFSFKTKGTIVNKTTASEVDFNLDYDPKSSNAPYVKIFLPKIKASQDSSILEMGAERPPSLFVGANLENALKAISLKKIQPDINPSLGVNASPIISMIRQDMTNIFSALKNKNFGIVNAETIHSSQELLKDKIKQHFSVELAQPSNEKVKTLDQRENISPSSKVLLANSQPVSIQVNDIQDFKIDPHCKGKKNERNFVYLSSTIALSSLMGSSDDMHAHTVIFPNKGIDCNDPATYEKYSFSNSRDSKEKQCQDFVNRRASTAKVCLKMRLPENYVAENLKDNDWIMKNAILEKNDNIDVQLNLHDAYVVGKNGAISREPYRGLNTKDQKMVLQKKIESFFKKEEDNFPYSVVDFGINFLNKSKLTKMLDSNNFPNDLERSDNTNIFGLKKAIMSSMDVADLIDNKSYSLKTNISNLKIHHEKCQKSTSPDYVYAGMDVTPEAFLYKDPNHDAIHEVIFSNPNVNCDHERFLQTPKNKKKCLDIKSHTTAIVSCVKLTLPPGTQEQKNDIEWIKKNAYIEGGKKNITIYHGPKSLNLYTLNSKGEFKDLPVGEIDAGSKLMNGIANLTSKLISSPRLVKLQLALKSNTSVPVNPHNITSFLSQTLTEEANKALSNKMAGNNFSIDILQPSAETTVAQVKIEAKNALVFLDESLERMKLSNRATESVAMRIHDFLDQSCVDLYSIVKDSSITKKMCNLNVTKTMSEVNRGLEAHEKAKIAAAFSKKPHHLGNVLRKIETTLYKNDRASFIDPSHTQKIYQLIKRTAAVAPCIDKPGAPDEPLSPEIKPFCDKFKKDKLNASIGKLQALGSQMSAVVITPNPSRELALDVEHIEHDMRSLSRTSSNASSASSVVSGLSSATSILTDVLHGGPIVEINQCVGPKAIASVDLEKLNTLLAKLHKKGVFSLAAYANSLDLKKPNIQFGCKNPPKVALCDGNIELSCDRVFVESSRFYGLKKILNFFGKNNGFKVSIDIKKLLSDQKDDNFLIKSVGPNKRKNFLQRLANFTLLGDFFVRKALNTITADKNPTDDVNSEVGIYQNNRDLFVKLLKESFVGITGTSDVLRNRTVESIQPHETIPGRINVVFGE